MTETKEGGRWGGVSVSIHRQPQHWRLIWDQPFTFNYLQKQWSGRTFYTNSDGDCCSSSTLLLKEEALKKFKKGLQYESGFWLKESWSVWANPRRAEVTGCVNGFHSRRCSHITKSYLLRASNPPGTYLSAQGLCGCSASTDWPLPSPLHPHEIPLTDGQTERQTTGPNVDFKLNLVFFLNFYGLSVVRPCSLSVCFFLSWLTFSHSVWLITLIWTLLLY